MVRSRFSCSGTIEKDFGALLGNRKITGVLVSIVIVLVSILINHPQKGKVGRENERHLEVKLVNLLKDRLLFIYCADCAEFVYCTSTQPPVS